MEIAVREKNLNSKFGAHSHESHTKECAALTDWGCGAVLFPPLMSKFVKRCFRINLWANKDTHTLSVSPSAAFSGNLCHLLEKFNTPATCLSVCQCCKPLLHSSVFVCVSACVLILICHVIDFLVVVLICLTTALLEPCQADRFLYK